MAFIKVPRNLLQEQHDSLMEAFEARDVGAVNGVMARHRLVTLEAIRRMHATAAVSDPDVDIAEGLQA